jgi:hypothetical protein
MPMPKVPFGMKYAIFGVVLPDEYFLLQNPLPFVGKMDVTVNNPRSQTTMMKLRMRKAKGLEHRLLSPETVESSAASDPTACKDRANDATAFWNNGKDASESMPQFSNTFSIDVSEEVPDEDIFHQVGFPEESFIVKKGKEPVWLRRKAQSADMARKSQQQENELDVKEIPRTSDSRSAREKDLIKHGGGKKGHRKVPLKSEYEKTSSERKNKPHHWTREEDIEDTEDDKKFDELVRPSSTLSDMLSLSFLDEDFSLGTPTIYTDSSEDKSSFSSDSIRRDRRSRTGKYDDEAFCAVDEYLDFGLLSCRISEPLKALTDALGPGEPFTCADGQETILRVCEADTSKALPARRRRKSRHHIAMAQKEKPDSRRLV